jgi:hypothetical protein
MIYNKYRSKFIILKINKNMENLKDKILLLSKKYNVGITREDLDKLDDKAIILTYKMLNDLIVDGEKQRQKIIKEVEAKKRSYDTKLAKTLQYKDILAALNSGEKPADIALKYGLSKGRISQIKLNNK